MRLFIWKWDSENKQKVNKVQKILTFKEGSSDYCNIQFRQGKGLEDRSHDQLVTKLLT